MSLETKPSNIEKQKPETQARIIEMLAIEIKTLANLVRDLFLINTKSLLNGRQEAYEILEKYQDDSRIFFRKDDIRRGIKNIVQLMNEVQNLENIKNKDPDQFSVNIEQIFRNITEITTEKPIDTSTADFIFLPYAILVILPMDEMDKIKSEASYLIDTPLIAIAESFKNDKNHINHEIGHLLLGCFIRSREYPFSKYNVISMFSALKKRLIEIDEMIRSENQEIPGDVYDSLDGIEECLLIQLKEELICYFLGGELAITSVMSTIGKLFEITEDELSIEIGIKEHWGEPLIQEISENIQEAKIFFNFAKEHNKVEEALAAFSLIQLKEYKTYLPKLRDILFRKTRATV